MYGGDDRIVYFISRGKRCSVVVYIETFSVEKGFMQYVYPIYCITGIGTLCKDKGHYNFFLAVTLRRYSFFIRWCKIKVLHHQYWNEYKYSGLMFTKYTYRRLQFSSNGGWEGSWYFFKEIPIARGVLPSLYMHLLYASALYTVVTNQNFFKPLKNFWAPFVERYVVFAITSCFY